MIDFMANIKSKKNMTMCNIKTLIATSVLCVFFNGAAIYGMKEKKGEKKRMSLEFTKWTCILNV